MTRREIGKNRARVVGDDRQPETLPLKFVRAALQLDQLRPAERSPVGGAGEDEHGAATSHDRLQVAGPAGLIDEAEIGHPLADLRPECGDVNPLARSLLRHRRYQCDQDE
jgi:hypothetical protein